jgi:hypothetical protein
LPVRPASGHRSTQAQYTWEGGEACSRARLTSVISFCSARICLWSNPSVCSCSERSFETSSLHRAELNV